MEKASKGQWLIVNDTVKFHPDGSANLVREKRGAGDLAQTPDNLENWTIVNTKSNVQQWMVNMDGPDDLQLTYHHINDVGSVAMYNLTIQPEGERQGGQQITSPILFANSKIQITIEGVDGVLTETTECVKNLYGGSPAAWRMPAVMLAPGEKLSMTLVLKDITVVIPKLPMLEQTERRIKSNGERMPFRGYVALISMHLLDDCKSLLDSLNNLGIDHIFVMSIPYSMLEPVVGDLLVMDYVSLFPTEPMPPSEDYPYNGDPYPNTMETAKAMVSETLKRFPEHNYLIIDDGGYITQTFSSEDYNRFYDSVVAVEWTRNGMMLVEDNGGNIEFPLVAFAHSQIKTKEAVHIGHAAVKNINFHLDEASKHGINNWTILVLGYGTIGSAVAKSFQAQGNDVRIYDIDVNKIADAEANGFSQVYDLLDWVALDGVKLIIDATGRIGERAPLQISQLDMVGSSDREVFFANIASKRSGLNYQELMWFAPPPLHDFERRISRFTLPRGTDFTVLNFGYPCNFHPGSQSVGDWDIQMVHAGILLAALQATNAKGLAGVIEFDTGYDRYLCNAYKTTFRGNDNPRAGVPGLTFARRANEACSVCVSYDDGYCSRFLGVQVGVGNSCSFHTTGVE